MRFKRVGRHARIIPPHFVQQDIACDDPIISAVQEFQDVGFLLRQADFLLVLGDEHLHRRLKSIRPEGENRVF